MKRFWLAVGFLVLLSLAACSAAGLVMEKPEYAIIMKSKDNQYNEQVAESYRQVMEAAGCRCEVLYPESAKAQDQIALVRRLIRDGAEAIAIAAGDEHALAPVLKEAAEKGIVVTTLDSDTEKDSRSIFVSPADPEEIGTDLVKSVRECMDGKGQWAILSAQAGSENQGRWIKAMRKELERPEYQNMRLVDIVYGEDQYEKSSEKTKELIEKYPDLRVICAPTTVGIRAAADVVKEMGLEGRLKVTGLGLPSAMYGDVGTGEADVCPVLYLWDPSALGRLSAYVSLGLSRGTIEAGENVVFETEDGGKYQIHKRADGGLEVTAGEPLKLDETNIGEWKDQM